MLKKNKLMKKIAIQGHLTRGADVIKILESLGGINKLGLEGFKPAGFYYIGDNNYINCKSYSYLINEYTSYTLEQYEQKFNNMEKRNIQIDLTTAKEWYKQGGDLRKIALQAFTEAELQSLPKSWQEFCEINPYINKNKDFFIPADGTVTAIPQSYFRSGMSFTMPSEKRAKQFVVLNKLLQIRDYYNQGWEPDWLNDIEDKYVITTNKNGLCRCTSWFSNYLFAFKTKELRDEFFQNFKYDLEFIKEFL